MKVLKPPPRYIRVWSPSGGTRTIKVGQHRSRSNTSGIQRTSGFSLVNTFVSGSPPLSFNVPSKDGERKSNEEGSSVVKREDSRENNDQRKSRSRTEQHSECVESQSGPMPSILSVEEVELSDFEANIDYSEQRNVDTQVRSAETEKDHEYLQVNAGGVDNLKKIQCQSCFKLFRNYYRLALHQVDSCQQAKTSLQHSSPKISSQIVPRSLTTYVAKGDDTQGTLGNPVAKQTVTVEDEFDEGLEPTSRIEDEKRKEEPQRNRYSGREMDEVKRDQSLETDSSCFGEPFTPSVSSVSSEIKQESEDTDTLSQSSKSTTESSFLAVSEQKRVSAKFRNPRLPLRLSKFQKKKLKALGGLVFCCKFCKSNGSKTFKDKHPFMEADKGISEKAAQFLIKTNEERAFLRFKCASCTLGFKHLHSWRMHTAKWHPEVKHEFVCHHCDCPFYDRTTLDIHLSFHDPGVPPVRKFTSWKGGENKESAFLTQIHDVAQVKNSQERPRPYVANGKFVQCDLCDTRCNSMETLREHVSESHPESNRKETAHHCSSCGLKFCDRKNLESHLAKSHSDWLIDQYRGKRRKVASVKSKFSSSHGELAHFSVSSKKLKKLYTGKSRICCPVNKCPGRFSSANFLKSHMWNLHRNWKPEQRKKVGFSETPKSTESYGKGEQNSCPFDECRKKFSSADEMNSHFVKAHSSCNLCARKLKGLRDYKVHLVVRHPKIRVV